MTTLHYVYIAAATVGLALGGVELWRGEHLQRKAARLNKLSRDSAVAHGLPSDYARGLPVKPLTPDEDAS